MVLSFYICNMDDKNGSDECCGGGCCNHENKSAGISYDIGPGSESFQKWQKMREETVFPAFREEVRRELAGGTIAVSPDLGEYDTLDFKIPQDIFPEEYAMLTNLKNSLSNKLNPQSKPYPTDIKPRFTSWTDSKTKEEALRKKNTGQWVDIAERMPQRGMYVPLLLQSDRSEYRYWVRAMFVEDNELELDSEQDPFKGCTEVDGTFYVPCGWYEVNEEGEVYHRVKDTPIAWLDIGFPSKQGLKHLNPPSLFDTTVLKRFNEHHGTPWKVFEQEYELWNGDKAQEIGIITAWVHGQLKQEASITAHAHGAKDGRPRMYIRRDDADFIVEAVNSYYEMKTELEAFKKMSQRLMDALSSGNEEERKLAVEYAKQRGVRPKS